MNKPAPYFWADLLREYLHDPPDKPLDIKGHASRGRRYAETAAGREFSAEEHSGAGAWADQRASEIERLPLPNAGQKYHRAIGPENNRLLVSHPLWVAQTHPSPARRELSLPELNESQVQAAIARLTESIQDPQARYLAVWRALPEQLAKINPAYLHLPAETRVPDHTIWQHLDMTAGLYAAYAGNQQLALLSLSIGPVQSFIQAARSVRDLWSGSMLLSWLAFQSMIPIIDQLGPSALVFPQLRGNPLMDLWLREQFPALKSIIKLPSIAARKSPCLPNRLVAIVPADQAEQIAQACQDSVQKGWQTIASSVHSHVSKRVFTDSSADHWDQRWQHQVNKYFDVHTQVLPWQAYDDETLAQLYGEEEFEAVYQAAGHLRALEQIMPEADRPGYSQNSVGRWQARVELLGRLLESRKLIREIPAYFPQAPTPPKCSLLGTYEQVGPHKLSDSARFWQAAAQQGGWTRLRRNERLSAIALIKRFAAETFFIEALQLSKADLALPDTSSLAASEWLKDAQIDPAKIRQDHKEWSGQWLHWSSPEQDGEKIPPAVWQQLRQAKKKQGPPPAYYSILMIDGDEMGRWLQGEKSPSVQQAYHPEIVNYYRKIKAEQELSTLRPVTPAYHGAISEALANFALHVAPRVLEKYQGALIYAGGDDVLALLPTAQALACAQELQLAFQGDPQVNQGAPQGYYRVEQQDYLMMGPSATLSAGLAVVHHKEDLRHALNLARQAEKQAKSQGRNALVVTAARRSGEQAQTLCLWPELDWMKDWIGLFQAGLSNHWTYHLRDTLPVMQGWSLDMMQAEMKRQIDHMDDSRPLKNWFDKRASLQQAADDLALSAGEQMAKSFAEYLQVRQQRLDQRHDKKPEDLKDFDFRCLENFILTCQTLAFLARGRED